jgi:hypothetical protein
MLIHQHHVCTWLASASTLLVGQHLTFLACSRLCLWRPYITLCQAIRDSQDRRSHFPPEVVGKAHYRRAQAHRELDDYEYVARSLSALDSTRLTDCFSY